MVIRIMGFEVFRPLNLALNLALLGLSSFVCVFYFEYIIFFSCVKEGPPSLVPRHGSSVNFHSVAFT